ncbi:MAG TPA: hypothetical protein VGR96_04520 [Acidobacteriaceae bacterium]|nr:hypothetical protein [Acidobacteriaceae bacterium]
MVNRLDLTGRSLRYHKITYPVERLERLLRSFGTYRFTEHTINRSE